MNVRAKIRVHSVMSLPNGDRTIQASPVYGNGSDNADYAKYTPAGSLSLQISADTKAVDFFEQGKEYYVDFTRAE